MSMRLRLAAAGAAVALAAGCAKPPLEAIDAAKQRARGAVQTLEAHRYAPEAVRALEDTLAAIDALVATQERRFALLRRYDRVRERLPHVDAAVRDVTASVESAKARMRADAGAMLARATSLADSVDAEYRSAPAGKGGRTALGIVVSELADVRGLIEQAGGALAAGKVAAAYEQGREAEARARKLLDDLRAAKAKVRALRARRADF